MTKKAKHTPGPWVMDAWENETLDFAISETGRMTDYSVYPSKGERMPIASVQHCFNGKSTTANARLIAAAPDLLEVLRRVDISIVGCEANATSRKHWEDDMASVKEMVRQALRAAVGAA
jgi:hypothetical protein